MKTVTTLAALLLTVSQAFRPSITSSTSSNKRTVTALQAQSGPMNCRPIGIGSAAPKTRISNADLESVVETSDEWITTRTGIGSRHVLTQGEKLVDLSIAASKNALEMAGKSADDLDVIICCSSSPDDLFGDATTIANALGCSKATMAFDLTAACSGFLFGVQVAGQFLKNDSSTILVVGADALSRWVDWDDRNTCILFGDGAGAMVLEASSEPGVLATASHSNGGGRCDLNLEYVKNQSSKPYAHIVEGTLDRHERLQLQNQPLYQKECTANCS